MKYRKTIALGFLLIISTNIFAQNLPTSAEELRSRIESAFKAKDTKAIISLFCWDETKKGQKAMMSGIMAYKVMPKANIISVTLSPLPTNFQSSVSSFLPDWEGDDGRRGKYNVPVIGMIRLNSQDGKHVEMPYGKKGDVFYLSQLVSYRIPGKDLRVDVSRLRVDTYTGYWVYVQNGKEITIPISNNTNELKMGWGDYVKYCYIRRTSITNVPGFAPCFDYGIRENVTNYIFDSGLITNEKPVIYERK